MATITKTRSTTTRTYQMPGEWRVVINTDDTGKELRRFLCSADEAANHLEMYNAGGNHLGLFAEARPVSVQLTEL